MVDSAAAKTTALTTHVLPKSKANRTIAADSSSVNPIPSSKKLICHPVAGVPVRSSTNAPTTRAAAAANSFQYTGAIVGSSRYKYGQSSVLTRC